MEFCGSRLAIYGTGLTRGVRAAFGAEKFGGAFAHRFAGVALGADSRIATDTHTNRRLLAMNAEVVWRAFASVTGGTGWLANTAICAG